MTNKEKKEMKRRQIANKKRADKVLFNKVEKLLKKIEENNIKLKKLYGV